jgi:hypothetical protein
LSMVNRRYPIAPRKTRKPINKMVKPVDDFFLHRAICKLPPLAQERALEAVDSFARRAARVPGQRCVRPSLNLLMSNARKFLSVFK